MSRAKVFKNIDEQIGILESKGLKIPEKEFAKIVLLKENYFFLSGYRHIFMKQNKWIVFHLFFVYGIFLSRIGE